MDHRRLWSAVHGKRVVPGGPGDCRAAWRGVKRGVGMVIGPAQGGRRGGEA